MTPSPTMPLPSSFPEREMFLSALETGYYNARQAYEEAKATASAEGKPEFLEYLATALFGSGDDAPSPEDKMPLANMMEAARFASDIQWALRNMPGTGLIVQVSALDQVGRTIGLHVTSGVPNQLLDEINRGCTPPVDMPTEHQKGVLAGRPENGADDGATGPFEANPLSAYDGLPPDGHTNH